MPASDPPFTSLLVMCGRRSRCSRAGRRAGSAVRSLGGRRCRGWCFGAGSTAERVDDDQADIAEFASVFSSAGVLSKEQPSALEVLHEGRVASGGDDPRQDVDLVGVLAERDPDHAAFVAEFSGVMRAAPLARARFLSRRPSGRRGHGRRRPGARACPRTRSAASPGRRGRRRPVRRRLQLTWPRQLGRGSTAGRGRGICSAIRVRLLVSKTRLCLPQSWHSRTRTSSRRLHRGRDEA